MRRSSGLRVARIHDSAGRLTPEFLTNLNRGLSERERGKRRGSVMIATAVGLMFVLAAGLFVISLAAQYRYVLSVKHDDLASWIEAVALDAGMAVFSLLGLGLARAGLPAHAVRVFIVACASGSAVMNYAASEAGSPRSVLAYVLPPLFLAAVVDQTITVIRRHYLGDTARDSAWREPVRVAARIGVYLLRLVLAPPSTARGLRRWILAASPLPELHQPAPTLRPVPGPGAIAPAVGDRPRAIGAGREGTKTARFLALVVERHGPLVDFPVSAVSRVCSELAPEVGLDTGAARTALRRQVLSAQNGSAS